MTLNNTVKDYLKTMNPESSGITCPACGSILGIRRQGSTEMILTENARLELDGYLASYRRYLEKLEMLLEQRNVYYKAYPGNYPFTRELTHYRRNSDSIEFNRGGVYKGIVAEVVIDKLIDELDFFEWIENFYSFPRRPDQQKMTSQETQIIWQKARDILVGGLEPRSITGPLMDLIFDQKYVADWREKIISSEQNFEKLQKFLNEICPAIQWYLQILQDINQQSATGRQPFTQKNQPDQDLEEGIIRVQFILAILLGHRSEGTEIFLKDISISEGVPFTLPRKTVVSPKYLQELLRCEPVLGNPKIGLSQELLLKLKQDIKGMPNRASNGDRASLEDVFTILREEIYKFVHLTCTGSASEKPKISQEQNNRSRPMSEESCGWYPKPEETHSVILLGSPGTGKSSVMLTGFTTFYDNVFALGATISFDSPEDEARMKNLNEDYWAGRMPQPTQRGARTTIKLSVEFPEKGYPRTNFVFTDVAGEVMARSLTSEGSDPAVLRILKNAETIIFFFDISIEPSIRKKLTEGDDGIWQVVEENFTRVRKSRLVEDSKNLKNTESKAEVSQLQLLQKLIQDLRVQRGVENLKNDINFICVIPKLDLFANETNSDRYFFSGFLKELKERDILVRSNRSKGDESFAGLRSLGGTSAQLPDNEYRSASANGDSSVSNQKQIGKWFSERTLHYLRNIGNALNADTAKPIKDSLKGTLEIGLIATLNYVFGEDKVYFLPVSSQGKDSTSLELGDPPNQKLSEYVFILPVVLSVDETQSNVQQRNQSQNPSNRTGLFGGR